MSDRCPEHGTTCAHSGIVIEWGTWEIRVEHRCGGSGDGDNRHTWTERSHSPDALMAKAGWSRKPFSPEVPSGRRHTCYEGCGDPSHDGVKP